MFESILENFKAIINREAILTGRMVDLFLGTISSGRRSERKWPTISTIAPYIWPKYSQNKVTEINKSKVIWNPRSSTTRATDDQPVSRNDLDETHNIKG